MEGETDMKVLVVGSGGREHAIVTSVAKSPRVDKIYCAPGNAGIAALAECVPIGAMEFDKLVAFRERRRYDLYSVRADHRAEHRKTVFELQCDLCISVPYHAECGSEH